MKVTTLKEGGDQKESIIFQDIEKSETVNDSAVIGIYDIKLNVSDGVRFGFGLGVGMLIWTILFLLVSFFGMHLLISLVFDSTTSMFGKLF